MKEPPALDFLTLHIRIQARAFMQSALPAQGPRKAKGIIPQDALLFAGDELTPDLRYGAAFARAMMRRRLRRNASAGRDATSNAQVAGSGTGSAVKTLSATRLET